MECGFSCGQGAFPSSSVSSCVQELPSQFPTSDSSHRQQGDSKSSLHTSIALASGNIFAYSQTLHKCSCTLQPLPNFLASQRADGFPFLPRLPLQTTPKVILTLCWPATFQFLAIQRSGQNRIFCQAACAQHDAKSVPTMLLRGNRSGSSRVHAQLCSG